MRFLAAITMLILALAMVQPVAAQSFKPDYDAGYKAYEQKDYATALRHFRPLAKQGHAAAQFWLGYMYAEGEGVPEDDVAACAWFSIAQREKPSQDDFDQDDFYFNQDDFDRDADEDKDKFMDAFKRDLTPSQLEKGQVMAREIFERIKKRKAAKGE